MNEVSKKSVLTLNFSSNAECSAALVWLVVFLHCTNSIATCLHLFSCQSAIFLWHTEKRVDISLV